MIFIFKVHGDGFIFLGLPIFLFSIAFQVFMSIFNYLCIKVLICETLRLSLEVFIDRSLNGIILGGKFVTFNHLRCRIIIITCRRLLFLPLLANLTRIDHHQLIAASSVFAHSCLVNGGRWSRDRLDRRLGAYSVASSAFGASFHLSRAVARLLGLHFDHMLLSGGLL